MEQIFNKKDNRLLSLIGRAVCLLCGVFFLTSCQTKDPQLSLTTAEYLYVPFYNEVFVQTSALMDDVEIPENKQILAKPSSKPKSHFLSMPEIQNDPAVLIGYDIAMAQGFLGHESNIRRDKYSKTLQYYHKSCAIDVFSYDESEGSGKYVIEYVDLRLNQGATKEMCMDDALTQEAIPFEQYIASR